MGKNINILVNALIFCANLQVGLHWVTVSHVHITCLGHYACIIRAVPFKNEEVE